MGTTKTQTYLSDLKQLAKATGKDFAQVLQDMMAQIGGTIAELQPSTTSNKESPDPPPVTQQVSPTQPAKVSLGTTQATESLSQAQARPPLPSLSASDINPPDVQRYVVEHIVKTDEHSSHSISSQKLRVFSGKVPRPAHESDYDTWRSSVDLIMKDPALSDLLRSRKILESLLPPAADVVKHLSSDTLPAVYLQQLDSAYGTVQDGDELFAKFMDTFQDSGELPSTYLQRLQVCLNLAVRRGGVKETEVNKHLLNQFCRGCWDNTLISELQLTQKKSKPPSFADLLWLLRTEEDRKAAKAVRMKQHLGGAKQKAVVNSQLTGASNAQDPVAALTTLTQQLAKQMADMQQQLAVLTSQSQQNKSSHLPVQSLDNLLQIEGAAGQPVPYLGYVELMIKFHADFLGSEFEVQTLALVVPDQQSSFQSSVLIGMNTLEVLYDEFLQSGCSAFQPQFHGFKAVLKMLQMQHQKNEAGVLGAVHSPSNAPLCIPAGHTVTLEGTARVSCPASDKWAVVEHPQSSLPGGLLVKTCLVTLPTQSPYKVPVVIANETEQDLFIPPRTVIADLGACQAIISQHNVKSSDLPEPKPDLNFNFGESNLSPEWKQRITAKLRELPEVFALHDLDFGCTTQVKHHIRLHDETPFKHRARPIHPNDVEAVRRHLQELLASGVIRESESPFSSPIVVVRKKNGDIRLCIDYRKLNQQTIKDAYALPNLEETFSALTGSKWFSVLDLKSGYYQIEMNEDDKQKTAFVTPLGFWEFNRMPQGVTNAPSTFQRLMERCMGDLNLKQVLVFIDDLIIFSDTIEEHERRLLRVLNRLKEYGLKLSPEKCKFFQSSVRYLGHVVSERGVETDPEKISALKTWPIPKTLKELKSFLGFSGYYRRFIKHYADIVKPSTILLEGMDPLMARNLSKTNTSTRSRPLVTVGQLNANMLSTR
ncbi:hypothetical protein WMY93_032211 [Mugilogobius chulae]|uniref:ribonuclease H n=1 Tax=Mugilogobius chulae TaxID=88201 RepID=A0AAW0MCK7_9GOBI